MASDFTLSRLEPFNDRERERYAFLIYVDLTVGSVCFAANLGLPADARVWHEALNR